jgi:endonuclease YncB( thermonuclease family)
MSWRRATLISLLVAVLAPAAAAHAQERLVGQASVIDGDTIEIHGSASAYSGYPARHW